MDKQIRTLSIFSTFLVVLLMVSTTTGQFFKADEMMSSEYNTRTIYQQFDKPRGQILVQGDNYELKAVAYSEPTADNFKFQRVYPDINYAPITGFFSIANLADRGIEAALNDELDGEIPELALTNFVDFVLQKPPQGANVVLTVNDALQRAAMQELASSGFQGAVTAIEPSTGKVLALASYPTVDYNQFAIHNSARASQAYTENAEADSHPMLNRALNGLYPPGSTFKLVTTAAALETGNYSPETIVEAPIRYQLPGTVTDLPNSNGGNCAAQNGKESVARALEMSCNTAFAMLGVELGNDKIYQMANKFGVNAKFTLAQGTSSFPMVTSESFYPQKTTSDRLALNSIGQGDVTLTPLQDCLFASAIANNGKLLTPRIVSHIENSEHAIIRSYDTKEYGQVISEGNAKLLQTMSYGNVVRGVASAAAVSGVKVAGKTGTAENDPTKDPHGWFTGFAPLESPQIAINVFLENGGKGTSAATIASRLLSVYLKGGQK
jgi:peptidoglycan glycosyltransferase